MTHARLKTIAALWVALALAIVPAARAVGAGSATSRPHGDRGRTHSQRQACAKRCRRHQGRDGLRRRTVRHRQPAAGRTHRSGASGVSLRLEPRSPADTSTGSSWPIGYQIGLYAKLRARTGGDLASTIGVLVSHGVQFTREDFSWAVLEPRPGVFHWQTTDSMVLAAASQGLHIMAVPGGSPSWIASTWNTGPSGDLQIGAYAEFVRQVVARYGSRGSLWSENPSVRRVPIEMYDLWNEPYMPQFWLPGPDPATYARMFKNAVIAARPADPSAKFLLEANPGSFAPGSPAFLSAEFDAVPNLGAYADAVSVHPYASSGWSPGYCTRYSPSRGVAQDWRSTLYETCRLVDIRRILDARNALATKIMITEVGYSTAPANSNSVSQSLQATYVHDLFSLLRGAWSNYVAGVQWYQYQDAGNDPSFGDNFGFVTANGTPKPAWTAFATEAARGL